MPKLVLRQPGTEAVAPLEGFDGVEIVYRVPNAEVASEIIRATDALSKDIARQSDLARGFLGRVIKRIIGGDFPGGDSLEIETDDSGRIPRETMDLLTPIVGELWHFCVSLVSLRKDEQKNS